MHKIEYIYSVLSGCLFFVHAATWYPSSAFAETEECLWLASCILLFFHQMCWVLDAFQPCTQCWNRGHAFLGVRGSALHGESLRMIPPRVQFYQGCFRSAGSQERRGQASMTVVLSFVMTINRDPVTMERQSDRESNSRAERYQA